MDDLFNNIYVFHNGVKVSIAQHWDRPSDKHNHTNVAIQEVCIVSKSVDWSNMTIQKYADSLDDLINTLERIRDEIDKTHNQSSCQGNVGETQVTASCTTQEG